MLAEPPDPFGIGRADLLKHRRPGIQPMDVSIGRFEDQVAEDRRLQQA
jgi:hypothetical protein